MLELSYQLYSSRDFSIDETLKALADHGVKCVEGYDPLYEDAKGFAKKLKDFGLIMPSGHMGLSLLEDDIDACLKAADDLGIELIVAPWLDEDLRPNNKAGWEELGQRLAKIAQKVDKSGRKFAWHNHDFEFVPLMDNSLPIDALLAGSELIHAELDLAWIKAANLDPAAELIRLGARTLSVHIKDIAPMGENLDQDGWTDIGHGIMDFEAISHVLKDTAVRFKIMEHDNPKDPVEFINRSIQTAKEI